MSYTANRSVDVHAFSMIPRADIPRASFKMQKTLKTTFDAGYLVPIMCEEVLPGDTWNCRATLFGRLATPIFPVMDNLHLETFFFFVPNRLVWIHWVKFMGEQDNPTDSIAYTIPTCQSPLGGYLANSIFDYFGLPTAGQVLAGNFVTHSSLPLRCYNLIYNQWFREENLINSQPIDNGDGPDNYTDFSIQRRTKRHDYFTGCLPWPQKGGTAVTLPLGTTAPVKADGTSPSFYGGSGTHTTLTAAANAIGSNIQNLQLLSGMPGAALTYGPSGTATTGLYADLSTATAATINQIRLAFQTQRLLERDARGGTRYTEIVRSHFGVISPDARLQRPEYLGGGHSMISINPVAQTSGTGLTGGTSPQGNLAAIGHYLAPNHGFTQSFTEHGHIIGLVNVRCDLTYQQGMRRFWSRSTRYDFYFPAFAMLGEQAVLNKEIYSDGSANDSLVFGYQERWSEYRYNPSQITGLFRSTYSAPLDAWHYALKFTSLPVLNSSFIQDQPPLARNLAVGAAANGQQLLLDAFFDMTVARPMPMYSVPGMIDHF